MPVTQIPSRDPLSGNRSTGTEAPPPPPSPEQRDLFEAEHWETAYRTFNPDEVPHLLIQLQDDLSRARKREALWLSVILHLFVIILLWNTEKLMNLLPHRTVELALTNPDKSKDATFLELPPDEQKLTRRPDAKVISDKDRIATSKTPQVNHEELKKILQSAHPGPPGSQVKAPPAQGQPPQMAQNQQPQNQPQTQQPQNQQPQFDTSQSNQTAQLQTPPQQSRPTPNFNTQMTPGSAIAQAAQAAAENRGHYGSGSAGDYGLSRGRGGAKALDQAEILTDTMGVDFGPYLTRVVQIVKQNWYTVMPPSVFAPTFKQGRVVIEFVILKDGKTMGMLVRSSSGDQALDTAAQTSVTLSPLPPLPKEFPGKLLGVRFYYFYNLEPGTDLK